MANENNLSGTKARVRLFLDSDEVILQTKSWDLDMVMDEGKDDVGGENAARPWSEFSHWKFTGTCYMRDNKLLDAQLKDLQRKLDGLPEEGKSGGFRLEPEGKNRVAYVFNDITWDSFKVSMSGRTERLMANINLRFRYLKPGKAI